MQADQGRQFVESAARGDGVVDMQLAKAAFEIGTA
jgi:hypothetical protein